MISSVWDSLSSKRMEWILPKGPTSPYPSPLRIASRRSSLILWPLGGGLAEAPWLRVFFKAYRRLSLEFSISSQDFFLGDNAATVGGGASKG